MLRKDAGIGKDVGGSSSRRGAHTTWVQLGEPWIMLGLRGQELGQVRRCALDVHTGRVRAVELSTPWQRIAIPWHRVQVDAQARRMQLLAGEGAADGSRT